MPTRQPLCPLNFSSLGDCSGGRDERIAGAEGGLPGDRRVSVSPAAALPSDPQHHRRREELHHHFPAAAGDDAGVHQTLRGSLKTRHAPHASVIHENIGPVSVKQC